MNSIIRTGLGQNSRRFLSTDSSKECHIAGLIFDEVPGFFGNSDGDPVFHALCHAIESLAEVPILGEDGLARQLLIKQGITDSSRYLQEALKTLGTQKITHIAISLEGKHPTYKEKLLKMRENVATVMQLKLSQVGITAISGSGLTDVGCGDGIHCLCVITTIEIG